MVRFPFSDLSDSKLRPAVVMASSKHDDFILCQITSRPYADSSAIKIENDSFENGNLEITSYARPSKLFTANSEIITSTIGKLNSEVLSEIIDSIVLLLRGGSSSTE